MSGIVGIINLDGAPVDRGLLWRMTKFMSYRGPDAQEIWIDGHVGFGHTMLRTTWEAETEKQPLSLNGQVWLTADARIDGRSELIETLEAKMSRRLRTSVGSNGHSADSRVPNDAELILYAYSAWGEDCVTHLIGDFAFAIWNCRERRLFCARDQLGVRQFFYFKGNRSLIFSNTLDCIRLHPDVSAELNKDAVADFLLFGLNQNATTTTFATISRLAKAHSLTFSGEQLTLGEYWTAPHRQIRFKTNDQYIEAFKELLQASVNDRLRTSRVSISMSGGMDSSAVAATASQLLRFPATRFDLKAFCVAYDGLFPDREREYAGQVAEALRIPLECLEGDIINENDSRAHRAYLRPEPFQVEPFYAVIDALLQRMSTHGRVALTGWDGDMIMNESPKYLYATLLKKHRVIRLTAEIIRYVALRHQLPPVGFKTSLKRLVGSYPPKPPFPVWFNENFSIRLNLVERWQQVTSESPVLHPTRPYAARVMSSPSWEALFERYDAGINSLPLEVRHPLVDLRLVTYALGLPVIPWVIDKHILRAAMFGILPEQVRLRQKTPLAGEPALGLTRSKKFQQIDEFRPTAEILAYINRRAIPEIAGERNANSLWTNARPFVLNQWLLHSLPIEASSIMEDKYVS